MPRIGKPQPKLRRKIVPFAVGTGIEKFDSIFYVFFVVQRLDRRSLFLPVAAEIPGVFLLNAGGIAKHDVGNVRSRRCAENRSAKTGAIQARQITAVIDMRM